MGSYYVKFVEDNLAVMSVGFLLGSPDDAVIWRGPKKNGRNNLLRPNLVFFLAPLSLHVFLTNNIEWF